MGRYRGRVKGFYTDKRGRVRPITARRYRRTFTPSRVVHFPVPKQTVSHSINRILSLLDVAFPKLMPVFETGRLLINNRELLTRFIKNLFSDKTAEKKIETIENELIEHAEEKITSEFAKNSATTVSNLLREQGYFDLASKAMNENYSKTDADLLQNFFENTFEGLIRVSITGALGVAK